MMHQKVHAVVLAAGKSRRLGSGQSKLLQPFCGKPLITYPVGVTIACGVSTSVVLGFKANAVQAALVDAYPKISIQYAFQDMLRGTAHALNTAREQLLKPYTLVLNGDMPLLRGELVSKLYEEHLAHEASVSFIAGYANDPNGYGRVIKRGTSVKIVEQADCSKQQQAVDLVNGGIYLFKTAFLLEQLELMLAREQDQDSEYYLTDLVARATKNGFGVHVVHASLDDFRGVNTFEQLWEAEHIARVRIIKHWMSKGVRFSQPLTTCVDVGVSIGAGTFIGAGVQLLGETTVGEHCILEPFSLVRDSILAAGVVVRSHSSIAQSSIGADVSVGPFARLRDGVSLEKGAVIGNFVEVKKSTICSGAKAKHLAYLGNAVVGKSVNIGAGTITCNHDGVQKHVTKLDENAYIGSNTTLVAPVTVGEGAVVAAGSTITRDVAKDDLAIGRKRQQNKAGYAVRLRSKLQRKRVQGDEVSHIPARRVEPELL